jgi:hypothetical protein
VIFIQKFSKVLYIVTFIESRYASERGTNSQKYYIYSEFYRAQVLCTVTYVFGRHEFSEVLYIVIFIQKFSKVLCIVTFIESRYASARGTNSQKYYIL